MPAILASEIREHSQSRKRTYRRASDELCVPGIPTAIHVCDGRHVRREAMDTRHELGDVVSDENLLDSAGGGACFLLGVQPFCSCHLACQRPIRCWLRVQNVHKRRT